MNIAVWLSPATACAVVAVIVWLVRLEARAKRAEEKAQEACVEIKELERELDALRPVARHLEVLAERMSNLIDRVAEGARATSDRFDRLEGKIDHAMNNARQAHLAAEALRRRADAG